MDAYNALTPLNIYKLRKHKRNIYAVTYTPVSFRVIADFK